MFDQPFLTQSDHFFGCVGDREQAPGGLVDAGVSRLCLQNNSNQQRVGIHMFQLALRLRFAGAEPMEDLLNPAVF